MPEIIDRFNFEPEADALYNWLYTKKISFNAGNTKIPGFFGDFDQQKDRTQYFIAIALELVGVATMIFGGIQKGGFYILGAIIVAIVLFRCDIALAKWLHRNKAKNCYIDNKLFLLGDSDIVETRNLQSKKTEGNIGDNGFKAGLVLIVIVKILGVVLLGVFTSPIWIIIFAALYSYACYVHIAHTGYYLANNSSEKTFKKQHDAFAQGEHKAKKRTHRFESDFKLELPIQMGGNNSNISITEDEPATFLKNEQTKYRYKLNTTGVLFDKDIIDVLMDSQEENQKRVIAVEARRHQFDNMCRNPLV